MKMKFVLLFVFSALCVFSQQDSLVRMTKFDRNYIFTEGIYLTFDEFKNNKPSITEFKVVRNSQFSGDVQLEYPCLDEKTGALKTCEVQKCWGYVQNNSVFISQGIDRYFFRLHIIGALIHYYSVEVYSAPYYDYSYGYPDYRSSRRAEVREYVIEFDTGRKIEFDYSNFSAFLRENAPELYNELQASRKKKKMIYHFLIKYNEKHPVYFPE